MKEIRQATTQGTVLMALGKYPDGLVREQLAEETNSASDSSLGRALRSLIKLDYVEYHNGAYRLTQSGRDYTALWETP